MRRMCHRKRFHSSKGRIWFRRLIREGVHRHTVGEGGRVAAPIVIEMIVGSGEDAGVVFASCALST